MPCIPRVGCFLFLSFLLAGCGARQTDPPAPKVGGGSDNPTRATGDDPALRRQDGGGTAALADSGGPNPENPRNTICRFDERRVVLTHKGSHIRPCKAGMMRCGTGAPGLDLQRVHRAPGDKSGVALLDRQPVIMTSGWHIAPRRPHRDTKPPRVSLSLVVLLLSSSHRTQT